jgi:3-methylcrotonyl-CoA carboxylase alpha subunit
VRPLFSIILIANRGEIACRVMRTARRLGMRSVAVYSDADRDALHVEMADEAYRIGPPPARDSYLNADAILDAARRSGAEAIHPGYGFLSENAGFAETCAAAGVIFIGPPASAIRAMGGKAQAKALMERTGVPLVPGYHGPAQDAERLALEAAAIGYPVLIKASAGGGGKGMKVAAGVDAFAAALAGAKREAAAAFGDDTVLIERYLESPRHVEVQIFADQAGNCVYLSERDCSIQRRHQKILEEAPAPGLPAEIRKAMGEAAVVAAKAVRYVGAGTVEFLYTPATGAFYFIEMNTRLQVEHAVTEMITGLDLVEWQFRIAAGEPLPLKQSEIEIAGHAIEARVYAEDADRDFLPQTGRLDRLDFPPTGAHLRVDTGVRTGDAISLHYDPMIAKLIAWDVDRPSAARRLKRAIEETQAVGAATNLRFLAALAGHPAFLAGELDTGFIDRHRDDLLPGPKPASERIVALAALGLMIDRRASAGAAARASADPWSPWGEATGWRLNLAGFDQIHFREPSVAAEHVVEVEHLRDGWRVDFPGGRQILVRGRLADGNLAADLDGVRTSHVWLRRGAEISVFDGAETYRFTLVDPVADAEAEEVADDRMTAPMPGRVIALLAEAGARVAAGQPLIVLEAMKMEHTIKAPSAGIVEAFRHRVGDQVEEGEELVVFRAETIEVS